MVAGEGREGGRETDRQTDRGRETDREIEAETRWRHSGSCLLDMVPVS